MMSWVRALGLLFFFYGFRLALSQLPRPFLDGVRVKRDLKGLQGFMTEAVSVGQGSTSEESPKPEPLNSKPEACNKHS